MFWKSKPWTGCYGFDSKLGCDSWLRIESQPWSKPWSQPWSKPPFQNVSGLRSGLRITTLNRNLKVQGFSKFATLVFFLWLRSGLRKGFWLQFCNPKTFCNNGDDQVVTRVAIRIANHNPELQPETTRLRIFGKFLQPWVFSIWLWLWFWFRKYSLHNLTSH